MRSRAPSGRCSPAGLAPGWIGTSSSVGYDRAPGGPGGAPRKWQRSCRQRQPSACRQALPFPPLSLIAASSDRDGPSRAARSEAGRPDAARPGRQLSRCPRRPGQPEHPSAGAGRAVTDELAHAEYSRRSVGGDRHAGGAETQDRTLDRGEHSMVPLQVAAGAASDCPWRCWNFEFAQGLLQKPDHGHVDRTCSDAI